MNRYFVFLLTGLFAFTACGQQPRKVDYMLVGGGEGCEAIFESPIAFERLNSVDTLPDFSGDSKMLVSGVIVNAQQQPVQGVVVYIYHTDANGIYPASAGSTWAQRHGKLRGWAKTDKDGKFLFYTSRPAPYPGGGGPAHIHVTIAEPNGKYYWVDDYFFDDDPLLTDRFRNSDGKRGGSGIVVVDYSDAMMKVHRTITLGLNITGYR